MKRNYLLCCIMSLCIFAMLSCMSKEEKERKRAEKAKVEREQFVNDSMRVELEKSIEEAEKQKKLFQDSIAKAQQVEAIKNSIKITSYYLSEPNSANGVSAYFYYKNLSDKTIKYLCWEGYPINAVGDAVSCSIRDISTFRGRDTGPIKKGHTSGGCWDCAWYNSTAHKLILTSVDIEYMDGSTLQIQGEDLYVIGKKRIKSDI